MLYKIITNRKGISVLKHLFMQGVQRENLNFRRDRDKGS